ncbi:MAG: hypothetical protein WBH01_05830 [Dehalococcoidia bacterium]
MKTAFQSWKGISVAVLVLFILPLASLLLSIPARASENVWRELDTGIDFEISPESYGLHDIWANSASDIFAVGDNGVIVHYDGSSWHKMNSGVTSSLSSVWGSSSSDVFVTTGGTILHYDGSTWSEMATGGYGAGDVWGSSASDVYAVGGKRILHYDGGSWTEIVGTGSSHSRYGVWASSSSDVFVIGSGGRVEHYDGSTWTLMDNLDSAFLLTIWGSSSSDVFAGGDKRAVFHYDGSTWRRMSLPHSTHNDQIVSFWGSSPSNIFAVSNTNAIYRYDGSAWTEMNRWLLTWNLWGIGGSSANDVYAVGYPCHPERSPILHYPEPEWLGDAVDNVALTWSTGGSAKWIAQTCRSYYDGDAVQSGYITHNQATWIRTTVTGPGTLSFYWMVRSQDEYDCLEFHIDGLEQVSISGSPQWEQETHSIASGTHIVEWRYTKDGSQDSDMDRAWLDKVEFTSTPTYALSVYESPSGSGTVTPSPSQPSGGYTAATEVTLTAEANEGYEFDHWSGTSNNNINPTTVTMNSDKSVTAYFEEIPPDQHTLSVSVSGQGTTNPSVGSHGYDEGTEVTVTAYSASGWEFDHWSGALSGSQNPTTMTMDSDKQVSATFIAEGQAFPLYLIYIIGAAFGVLVLILAIRKVRKKALSPMEQLEKEKQEIIEMIDEALEEEKRRR